MRIVATPTCVVRGRHLVCWHLNSSVTCGTVVPRRWTCCSVSLPYSTILSYFGWLCYHGNHENIKKIFPNILIEFTYNHNWYLITAKKHFFFFCIDMKNKANLRDLIAATGRVILLEIGIKSWIFLPMYDWNLMDDLETQYGTSSILHQALRIISFQVIGEFKLELQSGNAQFG